MNATTEPTVLVQLFAAALEARKWLTKEELEAEVAGPNATGWTRHDWRNHLPDCLIDRWDELPIEARLTAVILLAPLTRFEEEI